MKRFKKTRFSKQILITFILIFAAVGGYYLIRPSAAPNPNLTGDLNNDNTVNIFDLSILLSAYNTNSSSADLNLDNTVNIFDLSILLSNYGKSFTPSATKLTWAAPVLTNAIPVTIQDSGQACPGLPNQNLSQPWTCKLQPGQDYVLKIHDRNMSSVNMDGLSVDGGRNVVVVGGKLTPGPHTCCDRSDEWKSRGIQFVGQTGTVHIEGLHIADASDAILLSAPNAIFQIENVRVTNLHAYQDNVVLSHPDVIQTFETAREVRIDHLTADSDYQGFSWFKGSVTGWVPRVDIRNVNFTGNLQPNTVLKWPDGTTRTKTNFHLFTYMNYTDTVHSCTNCWVATGWYNQNYQRRLYESVGLMDVTGNSPTNPPPAYKVTGYDGQVITSGNNGSLSGSPYDIGRRQGDYIEFPNYANLAGVRWYWGTPTGGDFVPAGVAGPNYVSPGYQ